MTISFQVTEDCCMKCSYCYQHNKTKNKMTFPLAKQIIDNLLADKYQYNKYQVNGVVLDFIGGEPLMEIDLITQICDYFVEQCIKLNHRFLNRFKFSISSNGLLYFDERVQNFLKKYNRFVDYTISIDGNKELHDTCRVDLDGVGTYDRAIAAARHYRNNFDKNISTKMTLSPQNISYTCEALKNLISLGYKIINLNCIFEEGWNYNHGIILYNQLIQFADWLFETDQFKKYKITLFDENKYSPLPDEDTDNWCGGICNAMIAFDNNGKAFPCIRYMDSSLNGNQESYSIGSVNGLFMTEEEKERKRICDSITRQSQSTEECLTCPIAKGCSWCSAYNYEKFGTPNERATYICPTHKAAALASYYYYNKGYELCGVPHRKIPIYITEEEALKIISYDNWVNLCNL